MPAATKFRATVANRRIGALRRWLPARARLPVFYELNRLLGRLENELFLVPRLTEQKARAIDIGASSGYYSFVMSKCFARVEAFEPIAANTRNLTDFSSPKIHVHHVALSDVAGRRSFYLPLIDGAGSYGRASVNQPPRGPSEVIEVECRRLDDFAFRDVSLLKIDVEGHEFEVLRGARDTIECSRPVIIMEISKRNKVQVEAFFAELNYRPHILSGGRVEPLPGGLRDPKVHGVNFIYKPA